MNNETRQVLLNMKEHLSRGWVQGKLMDDGGGVCLLGSIVRGGGLATREQLPDKITCVWIKDDRCFHKVPLGSPQEHAMVVLTKALMARLGLAEADLSLWNDEAGRTVDDVVGLIDGVLVAQSSVAQIETGTRA
jgi:hypothetical protein